VQTKNVIGFSSARKQKRSLTTNTLTRKPQLFNLPLSPNKSNKVLSIITETLSIVTLF